ncbi:MAG: 3-methyl-2-oxobutanoate hydroxymethyltransferase [Rhodospirillales bacterium]|nr:3-methyl-2-oxobutanoate hydroxymethyltransferase [Rhodospirillales bacterium]
MSKQKNAVTVPELAARKGTTPIVCLTAYTTPMARIMDPHEDILLVGDSLGMVLYGMDTTLGVTIDMMANHGAAVVRGAEHACVIVDLPFGSYQESPEAAYRTASHLLRETGCDAIKLEGGMEMAETIRFLVDRGVPVMGHIGLKPQSVRTMGGFAIQGKDEEAARRLMDDARAVADAGAFSMVVEGTVEKVARAITKTVKIPTIGIGASVACDGQILVSDDMLGLFGEFTPKFVKRYADLTSDIEAAVRAYADDVRARNFPSDEHCFGAKRGPKLISG